MVQVTAREMSAFCLLHHHAQSCRCTNLLYTCYNLRSTAFPAVLYQRLKFFRIDHLVGASHVSWAENIGELSKASCFGSFSIAATPRCVYADDGRYGISQEQSLSSKSSLSPRAPQQVRAFMAQHISRPVRDADSIYTMVYLLLDKIQTTVAHEYIPLETLLQVSSNIFPYFTGSVVNSHPHAAPSDDPCRLAYICPPRCISLYRSPSHTQSCRNVAETSVLLHAHRWSSHARLSVRHRACRRPAPSTLWR